MTVLNDPIEWLLDTAHLFPGPGVMLGHLVDRLNDRGMQLTRVNIMCYTLHPQIEIRLTVWRQNRGYKDTSQTAKVFDVAEFEVGGGIVREIDLGHRPSINPAFKTSPLYRIAVDRVAEIAADLRSLNSVDEFPIFADFVEQGATGYFAHELLLDREERGVVTWLTEKPGGFDSETEAMFRRLSQPLALIVSKFLAKRISQVLLNTYLGTGTGQLVLAGNIKQGDVQRLQAAIWFSDLRGFTGHSVSMSPEDLVAMLNQYFSVVAKAIRAEGGEILKFIGDAVLAIFPITTDRSQQEACAAALRAAVHVQEELHVLNAECGAERFSQGVALHVGEVQYGNIGAEDRLDFTVIGRAVNLAARIEGLCGKLGLPVLLSAAFAKWVQAPTIAVGDFELKGIPGEQSVFRLQESSSGLREPGLQPD